MSATVVLVHGAWHGPSCWDLLQTELRARGVDSKAVSLPSSITGAIGGKLPDTNDDALAVRSVLDTLSGPVLLVGHSYGGVVISAAGDHQRVGALVYLAAFCLDEGETAFALAAGDPPPLTAQSVTFAENGTCSIKPELAVETFYADMSAAEATKRARSLVPTTLAVFTTPTTGVPAWKQKRSTYVVCANDRAISPDGQAFMASRSTRDIVNLATSHSPFLSQPSIVAELLVTRLAGLCDAAPKVVRS
jgi:pimeloyl-ACP methyl ester carboxylesterase